MQTINPNSKFQKDEILVLLMFVRDRILERGCDAGICLVVRDMFKKAEIKLKERDVILELIEQYKPAGFRQHLFRGFYFRQGEANIRIDFLNTIIQDLKKNY